MPNKFAALLDGKLPVDNLPFTIGWELEFSNNRHLAGCDSPGSFAACSPGLSWVGEHCGVESRSPVFRSVTTIDEYIKNFFVGVKAEGFETNQHCGGHIHIGQSRFTAVALSRFLIGANLCHTFFFRTTPPYRHVNTFCGQDRLPERTAYLAAVRRAAPLLTEGTKKYRSVVSKLPVELRPKNRNAPLFRGLYIAADEDPTYNNPVAYLTNVLSSLRGAMRPHVALGLPYLYHNGDRLTVAHGDLDYGWVRVGCDYNTQEFRLFPASTSEEEWAGYVAMMVWFTYKFRTAPMETLAELLSHSDEEILHGEFPFADWPTPLRRWITDCQLKHKFPIPNVRNKIQTATAA